LVIRRPLQWLPAGRKAAFRRRPARRGESATGSRRHARLLVPGLTHRPS
jgi:hypothetical protein